MLDSDKVFAGSVPENYDRHMVPLIFAPYAADMAQRAAALSPDAVLEIAAGTGVVTRALAPRLSPDASYVVTDLDSTNGTSVNDQPTVHRLLDDGDVLAIGFHRITYHSTPEDSVAE